MTYIHEAFYEGILYDRIPSSSGEPEIVPVDRFPALSNISWSKQLNDEGSASISSRPERLSPLIQKRLLDPAKHPLELGIFRDSEKVFQGPVIGIQYQGRFKTITLVSRGLQYYLRYIYPRQDYDYSSGEDPFVIVKAIIDAWQALPYGHFGIDTSAMGTSAQSREIKYLRTDIINVTEILKELSSTVDGFDYQVDPLSRQLLMYEGGRGTDKTDKFTVDERTLRSASVFFGMTAGAFASDVIGVGQGETDLRFTIRQDATRQQEWGRAGIGFNFQNVESQSQLEEYGDALLDIVSDVDLSFGGAGGSQEGEGTRIIPVKGMTPKDVDPGDQIGITVDLGFGHFNLTKTVIGVFADVDIDGKENMNLAVL
jgi:hypothetical protein